SQSSEKSRARPTQGLDRPPSNNQELSAKVDSKQRGPSCDYPQQKGDSGSKQSAPTDIERIQNGIHRRRPGFFRVVTKTGGPFYGAQTIDATSSDITILAADLRLETDTATLPDDIIGIEAPILTEQWV